MFHMVHSHFMAANIWQWAPYLAVVYTLAVVIYFTGIYLLQDTARFVRDKGNSVKWKASLLGRLYQWLADCNLLFGGRYDLPIVVATGLCLIMGNLLILLLSICPVEFYEALGVIIAGGVVIYGILKWLKFCIRSAFGREPAKQ